MQRLKGSCVVKLDEGGVQGGQIVLQESSRVSPPADSLPIPEPNLPPPPPHDCFLNVKMSLALEPFLPSGGGVVVDFGEGDGVEDGEGEGEACGVEVPP